MTIVAHINYGQTRCTDCGVGPDYEHKAWCRTRLTVDHTPKQPEKAVDMVNHPAHYTQGGIECIEAIEAALTPEEYRGYLKGQIFKYNWRLGHKDEPVQEAGKLLWYGDRLQRFLMKAVRKEEAK